ncbi:hypothetical protein ACNSPU_16910 [Bacillus velezensis]
MRDGKKEEEEDMATRELLDTYTLNDEEVTKILNTPKKIVPESGIFSDLTLKRKDRIEHAREYS